MEHQAINHRFGSLKDTTPEAEKVQIELLRKAGTAKRFNITLSLSQTVIDLARRALKRANPDLNEFELKILFLSNCYGRELAEKVKKYMVEKNFYEV
ncbi:MAG: hypothetical protein GTO20_07345 [Candidatus Aminicenantes bacterium]|nr:hypothetical protein [Candidatus Aminicenantes bacterium]